MKFKERQFKAIQRFCKYCEVGFDRQKGYPELTCRHRENIPRGCSWGECNQDVCLFIKVINETAKEI
jgi:hypothetical protein